MAQRIEVISKLLDVRAQNLGQKFGVDVNLVDAYTLPDSIKPQDLEKIAAMLTNPITEQSFRGNSFETLLSEKFKWRVEIGYLPGVTDNVGATVQEGIRDMLGLNVKVYSSQILYLPGEISSDQVKKIACSLANPLIQTVQIKSSAELLAGEKQELLIPEVKLKPNSKVSLVDLLSASDKELTILGKRGVLNRDGTRRGPLALDLTDLKTIQAYFQKEGRKPKDIELESLAQTWSEHCKHTIFANPLDEITGGLFKTFIKGATERIRQERILAGKKDFCISVFKDNSGGIVFDENYLITDKVETHNTPSDLDPFGGALTGIVGVNRDTLGFGLSAKPIINSYGFCFAPPDQEIILYRDAQLKQKKLSSRQILTGVVKGVNIGGNCSGIPTNTGFIYFDERYRGKPLVFVGTVGLIPRENAGRDLAQKKAEPGDYIVMVGGKVGKDGLHGATFSSEALGEESPATAVQIGDPITQKKLSDALVKEARDLGLYHSITDNGAGGLSCSISEMAQESGGCRVDLDLVPLKYPGLVPWEIWISESQERMTLAVPPPHWQQLKLLLNKRGVEAAIIGEFNASGRCLVEFEKQIVLDLDLNFLHHGLPTKKLSSTFTPKVHSEPSFEQNDYLDSFLAMVSRLNLASFEFISQQYDHEVQGGSIIKPLQGKGRVNGDATVTRPLLDSWKGIVKSQGINPAYSDLDTYQMAACAIDTAIRNNLACGGNWDHLALLDNFCWCSSHDPERLGQLKRAAQACYDYAVIYGTPFISGKDSMFNDFKGYDSHGNPLKISIPPTLLISAISVMDDVRKAVSLDAKFPGDLVYILGETFAEMGGSEYYALMGELLQGDKFTGKRVPQVNALTNKKLYQAYSQAIEEELIASAQSVHRGGLALALAKTALGGKLGIEITLLDLPGDWQRDDFALYSESQGRIVVTIAPEKQKRFKEIMQGNSYKQIGIVRADDKVIINEDVGKPIFQTTLAPLLASYRSSNHYY